MAFSFLHGGIALLGLASASVPILIHLLLKQKPKPLQFPALQLIRKKRDTTIKRMRLQHLLLLAMRVSLLVLIAMALARPTLRSSLFSIDQEAPVSAVVVVDTSPSMQYMHHQKTRLELAKELAIETIKKLPDGSKINVIDSSNPIGSLPLELPGAVGQIEALVWQAASPPINESLENSFRSLAKADLQRREVYVFTDLTANGWNLSGGERLGQLAELIENGVQVYVINVGVDEPENVSVDEVQVEQSILGATGELMLAVPLSNTGTKAVDINSIVLSVDGEPRHTRSARLEPGQTQEISFNLAGLGHGVHQGEISISSGDPLAFDDTRYFTIETKPSPSVLIVVDLLSDALNWDQALVPDLIRRQGQSRYNVDVITTSQFEETRLDSYQVVSLINVGTLTQEQWIRLNAYVQGGGGLFVSMGERIDPASYNSVPAQTVLPGGIEKEFATDTVLAPTKMNHPILRKFRELPHHMLDEYPVFRYRQLALNPGHSSVVIPYENGEPALVERTFASGARGRSLLWTTAAYRRGTDDWSDLPLGWSFLVLVDQVTQYLSGMTESNLNFLAGNRPRVELDPQQPLTLYTIADPTGHVDRVTIKPREPELTLPPVKKLGQYLVDAKEGDRSFSSGFSVNEHPEESRLQPIDVEELDKLIGKERLMVARTPDALERVVDEGRVGRELFSWIMVVVLVLVCVEGYFANRFYRTPNSAAVTPT